MGYLIFINLKIWLPLVDFESADTLTKILPILVPNYSKMKNNCALKFWEPLFLPIILIQVKNHKKFDFFFQNVSNFWPYFHKFWLSAYQNLPEPLEKVESKIQVIRSKGFCVICISVIWPSIFDIDFRNQTACPMFMDFSLKYVKVPYLIIKLIPNMD